MWEGNYTSRAHEKRKSLARTPTTMTMRSPQRKRRGAGAAWRLACALLITVHAAAAHERPAAAIANALVVANEQRASIDVPSATKSDTGSSSAGLQSVALLYRGATNLAPVVGSALLLASAVPARSSAWRAPVFGYLLFPGGFVRAAAVRGAARDNTINNFPSVATGVVPQERRQLSGYVMTDSNIRTAVAAWLSNSASAEATYGHISTWETGGVTDMDALFEEASSFNEDISAWDTSGVTSMVEMFKEASSFNQDISGWSVGAVLNMEEMFEDASSFNQDLGWCLDSAVYLGSFAFYNTRCESTSCGVVQVNNLANCPRPTPHPTPRPTLAGALAGGAESSTDATGGSGGGGGGGDDVMAAGGGAAAAAALLLAAAAFVFYRRSKGSNTKQRARGGGNLEEGHDRSAIAMPPPPPTGHNFCSACGAPLKGQFCVQCGARA